MRRAAPLAAALAVGGGAGAAIYAATSGGPATTQTVVASVPAAPVSQTVASTSTTLTQLYKNAAPGVVDVTVTQSGGGGFGPGGDTQQAEGSGFVVDTAGHIITNAHVVDGANSIRVRFQNGQTAKATLVGTDASTDIAVLKTSADTSLLHPLDWGNSSSVQVGQDVAAIGSPFGLPETMTAGIISATGRTITAPNNYSISGAIQTDAAINHGNSGGPLLTMSGQVIGVNAQIESDSGGNDGVGFAIPANAAKNVADTIISGGKVQHAYLGIRVSDSTNGAGAQIVAVVSGSPADKAGLKAGDVVTSVAGTTVASGDDLTAAVATHKPGDAVDVTITRDGKSQTLKVTLGVRPA
ncbi:MAG TPA: trypsin-like peptidase domain-containing protein [Gaiellaceae bacterium]|nr:trypsin-like peptidase domain-containing protein [Gaiellaceae bacterium]